MNMSMQAGRQAIGWRYSLDTNVIQLFFFATPSHRATVVPVDMAANKIVGKSLSSVPVLRRLLRPKLNSRYSSCTCPVGVIGGSGGYFSFNEV
jgi:hypothetical protein